MKRDGGNGSGSRRTALGVIALLLVVMTAGFLWIGPPSAVDWRDLRAVVIESDDWGFCGYVPDAAALEGLDLERLRPGRYPAVYTGSTLESADDIRAMAAILSGARGADGRPAVLQANYITASLSYRPGEDGPWRLRALPDLADGYAAPGLWAAVDEAVAAGCWWPEYHGYLHYDPDMRREAVAGEPEAATAAARGISLFPNGARAFELGDRRARPQVEAELETGLAIFRRLFGRPAESVIAPDYRWRPVDEAMWRSAGLSCVQAKSEQRPSRITLPGPVIRSVKQLERCWRRLTERRLTYVERNCRLEIVQSERPDAVVERCLNEVDRAWRRAQPAVVETHRVNFVHVDRTIAETGRTHFAEFLGGVVESPQGAPLFLTDGEVAMLSRSGVSYRRCGDVRILRNASHARRWISLPDGADGRRRGVFVPPRTHLIIHHDKMIKHRIRGH